MINILKMFAFFAAVFAFLWGGWQFGVGATGLLTLFAVLFPTPNETTQTHNEPQATHRSDSNQPHQKSD